MSGRHSNLIYRSMLTSVSNEIKKKNVSMDLLRFTLADYVKIRTNLEKAKSPFDLFMELDNGSHIKENDLKVVIAMLTLLGLEKIRNVIVKRGFKNPNVDPKDVFTRFRIRIVNIGINITEEKITEIAGVCEVPEEACKNQWKLLQYLMDNDCSEFGVLNSESLSKFLEDAGITESEQEQQPRSKNTQSVEPAMQDPQVQPENNNSTTTTTTEPVVLVPQSGAENNKSTESEQGVGQQAKADSTSSVDREKFLELLTAVGQWYEEREKLGIVKVLLRDILKENFNVRSVENFSQLFEKLHEIDILNPNNLTILYELINCTRQFGLVKTIGKVVQCPDLRDLKIHLISKFRIKLKNFGTALLPKDVNTIDGLYNMPKKKYKDPWELILDLEEKQNYPLTEDGLPKFIERLKKHNLAYACTDLVIGGEF